MVIEKIEFKSWYTLYLTINKPQARFELSCSPHKEILQSSQDAFLITCNLIIQQYKHSNKGRL